LAGFTFGPRASTSVTSTPSWHDFAFVINDLRSQTISPRFAAAAQGLFQDLAAQADRVAGKTGRGISIRARSGRPGSARKDTRPPALAIENTRHAWAMGLRKMVPGRKVPVHVNRIKVAADAREIDQSASVTVRPGDSHSLTGFPDRRNTGACP